MTIKISKPVSISHTTDIIAVQQFRDARGERYCISGHIRPGEYTAYYADDADDAEKTKQRLVGRGCHQIEVDEPDTIDNFYDAEIVRQRAELLEHLQAAQAAISRARGVHNNLVNAYDVEFAEGGGYMQTWLQRAAADMLSATLYVKDVTR
jgi:hypothetical protein